MKMNLRAGFNIEVHASAIVTLFDVFSEHSLNYIFKKDGLSN